MSCVTDHYGQLPHVFLQIMYSYGLELELKIGKYEMFNIVYDVYQQSKNLILNKQCCFGGDRHFPQQAIKFLHICKKYKCLENLEEETSIMRTMLESMNNMPTSESAYNFANLCIVEENFEAALEQIEIAQEDITLKYGSNQFTPLGNCYISKAECYVALGNQKMAKSVLKKLKKFENYGFIIENLEKAITQMPINSNKKRNVRTRMQCSSYNCKNIEQNIGAFKVCARCEIKYYCSVKCHKQHWRDGHKKECKKYSKKSTMKK